MSKVRGTPEQIMEIVNLRDEITRLTAEAKQKMTRGVTEVSNGLRLSGYGNGLSLISSGRTSARVYNGHDTWFDNDAQANGSAMQIEGRYKLAEASKLERMIEQKRILLANMKARLAPLGS